MSVALAGRSPSTFEIKSATLPLLALRLKSPDLALLLDELEAQYGEMPDFFEDDPVVVDLSALAPEHAEVLIDFEQLGELLHTRRLRFMAVRGGSEEQRAAAAQLGLLLAPDVPVQRSERTTETPAPPVEAVAPGALVIDRPLRSGQQVYARGRDLVLLAMVNHGAEVIADGHVHVYAPLRGRAIAGARGWPQARIFALDMQPDLVSIAGVYRTSDASLGPEIWGRAAVVQLVSGEAGDSLVFEPMGD